MKKPLHGRSLYYASDKNLFEVLNQHKVDIPTVMKLFQRRNIVVSKKTPRDELAKYFSTLTHDYYDHKAIATKLGVAVRRERTTSMDITGVDDTNDLQVAAGKIKNELEASGDTVQISRDGDNISIRIQYSTFDPKLSEFSQVQVRHGTIECLKSEPGYVVRNTQNDYLNGVRDAFLAKVEEALPEAVTLKRVVVALFDIPSAKLRTKFFNELAGSLPNFNRQDVTDVYVFKAKPDTFGDEDDGVDDGSGSHVEKVFLRGSGVSRSVLLNDLLDDEDYYIVKMRWTATESSGDGNVYDVEAGFADPKDCTGFSFILSGVFPLVEGKVASKRRSPEKRETDKLSRVIELKASAVVAELRAEYATLDTGSA